MSDSKIMCEETNEIKSLAGAAITAAIKTKLLADPDIKRLDIQVTALNGIVTLTGTVPTAAMKEKAISIAHKTDGVGNVRSKINVYKKCLIKQFVMRGI